MLMIYGNTASTGYQIPPQNTGVVPAGDYSAYDAGMPTVNLKAARKPFNCGPQERISIIFISPWVPLRVKSNLNWSTSN